MADKYSIKVGVEFDKSDIKSKLEQALSIAGKNTKIKLDFDLSNLSNLSKVINSATSDMQSKFNEMAKREPLQSVLVLGGAMEYHHDFAAYGFNPYVFAKDILVSFDDYGLCSIHPTGYEYGFIKISDLITLLNNKGLEKSFLLVEKNNGVGFDLLIEYDKIMSLGKTDELTLKRV